MISRRASPGAGFILIEVLVSLAVFSIGLLTVLTAVLSAFDLQKDSAMRLRAGLLLQEKLSEVAAVPWTGQTLQGDSDDGSFMWSVTAETWDSSAWPPRLPQPPRPQGSRAAGETRARRAQPLEGPETQMDTGEIRLVEVSVTVAWETTTGPREVNATRVVRAAADEITEEDR